MLKKNLYCELQNRYNISKADMFNSSLDALDNILAFVLHKKVLDIKLMKELELSKKDLKKIEEVLDKLCNKNIPFQYITGTVYIYGQCFFVTPDVLIPRQDTESLIHEAITKIGKFSYKEMLDLCTGSGVVGISVATHSNILHVDMSDISTSAMKVAKKNIDYSKVQDKCNCFISDMFSKIVDLNKKYDIITANPPYISSTEYEELSIYVKQEPYIALVAEDDGLYFYKKIAKQAKNFLNNGGALVLEIGYNEAEQVKKILQKEGYIDIVIKKDLNSNDRVVSCHFQNK